MTNNPTHEEPAVPMEPMVEPVEELVEELRFLSDARQQMGYDRAGSAMDRAATAISQSSEREAKLVAENERLRGLLARLCPPTIAAQDYVESLAGSDATGGEDRGG